MDRYLFALLSLLVTGCDLQETKLRREVFSLSTDEQWQMIRDELNQERKIQIYLIAMQQHPPALGLASAVAVSGEKAMPAIIDALDPGSPHEVAFLFEILSAMESDSYYCVHCDADVMATMESILERMSAGEDKNTAKNIFREIENARDTER